MTDTSSADHSIATTTDGPSKLPPIDPTEVRLDLLRNEVAIQLGIVVALIEIAATYASLGLDGRLEIAMSDARERMRAALGFTAKLMQARRDADLNREAAEEWRAQRDSRRRA